MKEIHLHVGFHKSGSTTIQLSCAINKALLRLFGYTYPVFTQRNTMEFNHSIPICSVFKKKPEKLYANYKQNLTLEEIGQLNERYKRKLHCTLSKPTNTILSGESISSLSVEELEEVKRFLEQYSSKIKVYCCVRSPYSFLCSMIQQLAKSGGSPLHSRTRLGLVPRIQKIQSVFNDVTFYPFNATIQNNLTPFTYFLNQLGIRRTFIFKTYSKNKSCGNLSTRLYSHVHQYYPRIINHAVNRQYVPLPKINFDAQPFLFTEDELKTLKKELDNENQQIAALLGDEFTDSTYPTSDSLQISHKMREHILSELTPPDHIRQVILEFFNLCDTANKLEPQHA